jgi:protein-export membrane protein SecD/preprotein translocase SecF subunit
MRDFALKQNITTLHNRINELGVAEPVIQQQGADRIVVQLPGVQDVAKAKDILGRTATLEVRMVDDTPGALEQALAGSVPFGTELYTERGGSPLLVKKQVVLTGDRLTDAQPGFDGQTHEPAVHLTLDAAGARIFRDVTRENVGKRMAILLIEKGKGEVVTAPVIRSEIGGGRVQISGRMSTVEANDTALLLRAGSLAAPMEIIEERTIGPSLGAENIQKGFNSTLWGFLAIAVFMCAYYMLFGLVSVIALAANLLLLVALLSLLQATLTLPGIAAIALTLGMAIDANVLINERIREELRNGAAAGGDLRRLRPRLGHHPRLQHHHADRRHRAAGVRLRPGARLRRGALPGHPDLDVQRGPGVADAGQPHLRPPPQARKPVDRPGLEAGRQVSGRTHRKHDHGILPHQERHPLHAPRAGVQRHLVAHLPAGGVLPRHPRPAPVGRVHRRHADRGQLRRGADLEKIRSALASSGYPDAQVQNFGSARDVLIRLPQPRQTSPTSRETVMNTLQQVGGPAPSCAASSSSARRSARSSPTDGAMALLLVIIGIVIYLAMRFEWRFAVSAIIANLHDVIIILGFFAFFQWEFSLPVLAAVLAVLGYSVNESVVVFDRVRETFKKKRGLTTPQVLDHAITSTISRTIITHGSTQVMVLSMLIFGGETLYYFALALTIGICFGIYSSVLVASPLVMWLGVSREQFIKPKNIAGGHRALCPERRHRFCRPLLCTGQRTAGRTRDQAAPQGTRRPAGPDRPASARHPFLHSCPQGQAAQANADRPQGGCRR